MDQFHQQRQQPLSAKPIVWTIAGSDSGGGAGIQTDLATINDLSCFGCSVITALTAQNSVTVALVDAVSQEMLLGQLNALAEDLAPSAIKIGLIANQKQLELIARWIKSFKCRSLAFKTIPIVLDPVMVASSGDSLNSESELDFTPFKGLVDLITPNAHELIKLTQSNIDIDAQHGFYQASCWLSEYLDCHVLAKGGDTHGWQGDNAIDLFVCEAVLGVSEEHQFQRYWLTAPRVLTTNNHGTGCTLSSAIAAFMAKGFVLHDAIVMAKAYVLKGLTYSVSYGKGAGPVAKTGWPSDISFYPKIAYYINNTLLLDSALNHDAQANEFVRLQRDIGIYPVVDDIAMLAQLLQANCTTVQLRIKADGPVSSEQLERDIKQAIALGRQYNAQVFINDHWQLALKHNAFGVHLGQEDAILADLPALKSAGIALGLSSHSVFEILLANQLKPSYIALGHIFATTTKVMPSKPQGLEKLSIYAELLKHVCPTVAIGGINESVLAQIKHTGVDSAAVVRAVTTADEPASAYLKLYKQWLAPEFSPHRASDSPIDLVTRRPQLEEVCDE
ncbi:bifunctional hydroxymethylpyrimidine kinase/phosphomethylpyrimidine kinase [Shewanella sp. UCD-FRSSP16_17]|uniref:bifunctional hydroxymethylpyrimidine kinase/phosphomethylpyrimidine kinase n=1 Tax=Shewanella sp. UCD-FRSSP16_17 TaxID=1853256 RepID=UPI0007EEB641|nr:bifunctional hydroxymethylpyrimidine kinase/phosphomethylpyrimidine kinase [Shewanella sp. UCD-FRSSP16_17]OBT11653.1 bifunctional hydroxymethylpyrimidine kinase/phosphomethylpyrimidine kinase [Shewanella sp. UCD-FRSSP16_17]